MARNRAADPYDETGHAELAAAVHAWAQRSLPPSAQQRLNAARRTALAALAHSLDAAPAPSLVEIAGVPTAAQARGFFAAAREPVFLAAA